MFVVNEISVIIKAIKISILATLSSFNIIVFLIIFFMKTKQLVLCGLLTALMLVLGYVLVKYWRSFTRDEDVTEVERGLSPRKRLSRHHRFRLHRHLPRHHNHHLH